MLCSEVLSRQTVRCSIQQVMAVTQITPYWDLRKDWEFGARTGFGNQVCM
ncbi:MAG: hypothetical protein Phyf2KO_05600 [Phycisphaerales bacterium]